LSSVKVFIEQNYCIISAFEEDSGDFVLKVNELLKEGWSLSGGLSSSNSKIFQALYKVY
tara:strand:- start:4756 stop:4932 length:177 start_codon:yes stop_codon:yes gene_type:complete